MPCTHPKVAVIDSGVDYRHPGLGGCLGPGCKVSGGYDFVGNNGGTPSTDVVSMTRGSKLGMCASAASNDQQGQRDLFCAPLRELC